MDPHELDRALERWQRAELLDADRAAAIAAFERDRVGDHATAGGHARAAGTEVAGGRRTRTAEAIGYVGAALAVGAVALILADLWRELAPVGRVTLAALVALVTGAASAALLRAEVPALQRLGSVLSAATVAAAAWTAGVLAADVLDVAGRQVATVVAVTAAVVALPAYLLRRRPLPQVVLLLSVVAAVEAVVLRSALSPDVFWSGLVAAAIAGAWVLLGVGGWLAPRDTATTAGGAIALLALQVGSFGDLRTAALVLAVVLAGGAVAAAVASGRTAHLAVGSLGLFVLLPQLVIDLFGDAIGAPATLLAVGLLLVLLAVGLGRVKREVDAIPPPSAPTSPSAPTAPSAPTSPSTPVPPTSGGAA